MLNAILIQADDWWDSHKHAVFNQISLDALKEKNILVHVRWKSTQFLWYGYYSSVEIRILIFSSIRLESITYVQVL